MKLRYIVVIFLFTGAISYSVDHIIAKETFLGWFSVLFAFGNALYQTLGVEFAESPLPVNRWRNNKYAKKVIIVVISIFGNLVRFIFIGFGVYIFFINFAHYLHKINLIAEPPDSVINPEIGMILFTFSLGVWSVLKYKENKENWSRMAVFTRSIAKLKYDSFPASIPREKDREDKYHHLMEDILEDVVAITDIGWIKNLLVPIAPKVNKTAWIMLLDCEEGVFKTYHIAGQDKSNYSAIAERHFPVMYDELSYIEDLKWWRSLTVKQKKDKENITELMHRILQNISVVGYLFENNRGERAQNLKGCYIFNTGYLQYILEPGRRQEVKIRSMIATPIRVKDGPIGVLMVFATKPFSFIDKDLSMLRFYRNLLGGLVDYGKYLRLYEKRRPLR